MASVSEFFNSLPLETVVVMGVSLGWVIGSLLLYAIIELFGLGG
jgi:hypothetical protein